MNTLELDPKDTAFSDAVSGCKVGDKETFEVTGTVKSVGEKFVLEVSDANYEEKEEDTEEESGEGEAGSEGEGMESEKMPKKGNPAIVLMMGKGGK